MIELPVLVGVSCYMPSKTWLLMISHLILRLLPGTITFFTSNNQNITYETLTEVFDNIVIEI